VIGGNDPGVRVEARTLQIAAGDRLVLCSDGLTEMLKHHAVQAVLDTEPEPEGAARALVAQANDAGGRDNITVVVVRFEPVSGEKD
jgi:PPM family protein phosphatase